MRPSRRLACLALSLSIAWSNWAWSQAEDELFDLSLEELLLVPVHTPGKFAQRQDEAMSVITVIDREEIRRFGATSLYEALERAPSVWMTGSHFYPQNVSSIRGDLLSHSNNHVLLLLDGRPLRDSFTGGESFAVFNALPLESIERIEIVRGPGSVLYGANAYAGVINLITRRLREPGDHSRVRIGRYRHGEYRQHGQHQIGRFAVDYAVRGMREDGWTLRAFDNNGNPGQLDAAENNLGASLRLDDGHWLINGLFLRSRQDFIGAVVNWGGQPPLSQREVESKRSLLSIGRDWRLGEGNDLHADLSYSQVDFDHYNYATRSRDLQGDLHWQRRLNGSLRWLAGTAFWRQDLQSFARRNPAPIPDLQRLLSNAYVEAEWRADAGWIASAGVQVNHVEGLHTDWVPRFGLVIPFGDNWRLRLLHGEAYRAPNAIETQFMTVVRDANGNVIGGLRGNPSIQPETVRSSDLALSWQSNQSAAALTLFDSRQSDLITRERAADRIIDFVNRGSLSLRGVEFEAQHTLDPHWFLSTAYTYQHTRSSSGIEDFTLVPRQLGKFGLTYQSPEAWSLGLFDLFVGAAGDTAIRNPARRPLNPSAQSYHQISIQFRLNTRRWLPQLGSGSELGLYLYNAGNVSVQQPEFAGLAINTLPARAERSVYASFAVDW